jgi:DNA-directed RNA polymerase specialized sigma24 family protein
LESNSNQVNQVLEQGVRKLLARAVDARALKTDVLVPRITAAVEKYLLRDDPNTSPADISAFIDGMQADDLCLIIACEQNDEGAWSDLVERFTPTVRSAARSASANEDAAEDLAQSIWAELYGLRAGKDGKRSTKLAYYSGRGSLAGWLRAVVTQLAVDTYRKQSRLVQTEEDTDLDRLAREMPLMSDGHAATASSLLNPEQVIANRLAGSDMQAALDRAVKEL